MPILVFCGSISPKHTSLALIRRSDYPWLHTTYVGQKNMTVYLSNCPLSWDAHANVEHRLQNYVARIFGV